MNSINIQRTAVVFVIVLILAMIVSSITVRNVVLKSLSQPVVIHTSQLESMKWHPNGSSENENNIRFYANFRSHSSSFTKVL